MPQDVKKLCRRYGLTYVETANLSLRRRRCGKGFAYVDVKGRTVREKALKARIRELAIPPAWTEVYIAEDDRAHIQAVALAFLTENNDHETEKLRKQAIVQAADKASEILVNTRSVARSSYIHPSVIKAYENGKLEASLFRGRMRAGLSKIESALMRFLERKPR